MTTKTLSKKMLLFAALLLLSACFSTCRIFDNETAYYNVEADGYVIFARTGKPVAGAIIGVTSSFEAHNWTTKDPVDERYFADNNGYYRIRFLKKVDGKEVVGSSVGATVPNTYDEYRTRWGMDRYNDGATRNFSPSTLQSKKGIMRLDTAKAYPRDSIF